MRKKQGILAIAFVIAALALGMAIWQSWQTSRSGEPVYQGKTLSGWLRELPGKGNDSRGIGYRPLVTGKTSDALAAEDALRHTGTNALPVLLQKMHSHQTGLVEQKDRVITAGRTLFRQLFSRNQLVPSPPVYPREKSTAEREHWEAARGFYALGPVAKPAIPELAALLNDMHSCADAAYALSGMGPEGLAQLTNVLSGPSDWTKSCAIWAMGQSPTNCAAALPQIISMLQGTNQQFILQMAATWSLGQIRSRPELAAPALAANLGNTNFNIQAMTEQALKEYGMTNFTAPALVNYLNDSQLHVRMAATNALRALFPDEAACAGVK